MISKPMLAVPIEDLSKLKFPLIASPKLDGIRCLIIDGKAVTRKFLAVPNDYIRNTLEELNVSNLDGEIMIKGEGFNQIQSKVMSKDGEPEFEYHIFDYVKETLTDPFIDRVDDLEEYYNQNKDQFPFLKLVPQRELRFIKDLYTFENECVEAGYEGTMVRSTGSPYKCGRSTLREGYLLKIKRFDDSEAIITGFGELMHNKNTKEINELGLSKRSTKKEGKVPANTLGQFFATDLISKTDIKVGTGEGLTKKLRKEIWDNRDKYLNKTIKYKYQGIGPDGKPRFPTFLGFRDERDI